MSFIVRRKDPPAYDGAKTYWQTVARRKTLAEARKAKEILKKFAKAGTGWWCGEETTNEESTDEQTTEFPERLGIEKGIARGNPSP